MKLNYYSEQTIGRSTGRSSDGTPTVTFTKNGIISFNKFAQKLIGLTETSKITLSQDEESPENWYVHIDPHHGFQLKLQKNTILSFFHTNLVNKFKELAELDQNRTYKMLIAGQPTVIKGDSEKTQYWCILIKGINKILP